jgi:septal ring factor EnvC (AmiA/AmiB activator)
MQPTPPTPPAVPTVQGGEFPVTVTTDGASPSAVLKAMEAQRSELRDQLDRVQEQRDEIARWLKAEDITQPDREGLAARLKETDARISNLEQQIGQADLAVAKASAVPGAVVEPPPPDTRESDQMEAVTALSIVFTLFVLFPIAFAYSRRLWKKGATVIAPVPREVTDRLEQMGQAVESIAIEVERIGEGQRFLTKVMSEQNRQLGAGAAQPIQVPQGQKAGEQAR